MLATIAKYVNGTMTVCLSRTQMIEAVRLLDPAEAAVHMPHPNLWSWRQLLNDGQEDDEFLAFFIADEHASPRDEGEAEFYRRAGA